MGYNRSVDRIQEYKVKYIKELGNLPADKVKAKIFIASRIGVLKKKLKYEDRAHYRVVLKKLIKVYENAK